MMLEAESTKSSVSTHRELFSEAVRLYVQATESKGEINPRSRAEGTILQFLKLSAADLALNDTNNELPLIRVVKTMRAVVGLGLSEEEIKIALRQVLCLKGIERFSDTALRSSLEDLVYCQQPPLRKLLLNEWPLAIFRFSKDVGEGESLLILFGGWLRGYNYGADMRTNEVFSFLVGEPRTANVGSYPLLIEDFHKIWQVTSRADLNTATPHCRAEEYLKQKAQLVQTDDPRLTRTLIRNIVSPLSNHLSGLLSLQSFARSSVERRALSFTWAALKSSNEKALAALDPNLGGGTDLARFGHEMRSRDQNLGEQVHSAMIKGLPIPSEAGAKLSATERVLLFLAGVDPINDKRWDNLNRSKFFKSLINEAPERIIPFVTLLKLRSEENFSQFLTNLDQAFYLDALNHYSIPMIMAMLPHVDPSASDLHPLMSVARAFQIHHSSRLQDKDKDTTFDVGVFKIDYGPPVEIRMKEDLFFAWKYDPRFVQRIREICEAWYSPSTPNSQFGTSRLSHQDMHGFVHKYLVEHRNFYTAFKLLQGVKVPTDFRFDDTPFVGSDQLESSRKQTFAVMSRSYDLALRFFTFFDVESKRIPGSNHSLLGRFLIDNFDRCISVPPQLASFFPGNGWYVEGLRLENFGLDASSLAGIFGCEQAILRDLSKLRLLVTQGVFAIWVADDSVNLVNDVPQGWVFYNRHFKPSGHFVSDLVDKSHLEFVTESIIEGKTFFEDARQFGDLFLGVRKNLAWIGNLSGSLCNSYPFDTGPFAGEASMKPHLTREPDGHVHKHYLLQEWHQRRSGVLNQFINAHHEIDRTFSDLELLFNATFMYPYSLFKSGFCSKSLTPVDRARMKALGISNLPGIHENHLLMLSYAEDIFRAVQKGEIPKERASILVVEDPLMRRSDNPKLALDCSDLTVKTWKDKRWLEIDDLKDYRYPERARKFWIYFGDFISDNSYELRSVYRQWIDL